MPFRTRLRADLAEARRAQNVEMVFLLRTLIAAIDTAEAVDPREAAGAAETARRHLSERDILGIILDQGNELRHAADEYAHRGHDEEAARVRSLSEVADRYATTFAQEHM
jgi:uncharacterized protein YqeY